MPRSRSPSAGRPSRRSRSLASFDSLGAPLALPVPSGARRHPLAPSTSSAAALAAGFSSPLPAVPYFISRLCSSLAAFAAARLLADPVAAPPVAVATALAASAAATAAAAFRRSVPVRPSAAALAAGAPVAAQLAAWVGAVAVLGALRALLLAAVAAAPVAAALRPRGGSSSPSSTAALGVGGGGVTASVARGRRTVVAVAVLVGLAALLTADMDAGSAAGGRRTATFGTARGGALSAAAGRRLAHSRAAARLGRISLAAVERVAAANGAGEKGGGVAGRVRHSVVAPRWARHAAVRLRERLAPDGVAVEGAEASAGVAALPLDDAALSVDGAALGADSAAPGVAGAGLLGNAAPLAGEAADLGDDNRAVPADNPLPPTVDSVRDAGGSWAWRHALRALTGAALVGFSCTWAASPAFVALAVELHSRRAARVAALYSAALLLALPAAATGLRSGLSPLPPLSAAPLVLVAAVGGIVVPAAMEHRAADRAAEPVPGFPSASGRHRSVSRHRGASAVGGGGKSSAAGHWAAMGAAGGGAIFGAFAGCSEGPAVGVVLFAVAATVAHFLVPGAEPGGAGGVSVAAVLAVALGALAAPFCVPAGGSGTDGGGVADAAGASGSRAGGNRSGLPRALRQVASVRRKLRSAANFVSAARRQHAMWQALTFLGFQAALVVGEWTYAAVSESPGLLSASADTLLLTSTTAAALSAASGACGNDAVRSIAAQVWANTVTCGAAVVGCGLRWAAGLRGGEVAATAVAALAITAAAGSLGVDAARRLCLGIPAGDAEAIDAATATIAASPAVGRVERAVAWPLPGGGVAAVARLRVVVGANESAVTADAVAAYVAAGVRREWVTIEVVGGA
ncbi:hypothetical protein I4F81_011912 [Pyropia yezoensis]|uniref:Uncharacterized protein n=1 Tax=Pyropia yezoensis TaxID=2788 RepID=A0ACC3CI33_PYRYE|nr:hypothetical protein I4F81_011912 [Neopyropia yezoensis]